MLKYFPLLLLLISTLAGAQTFVGPGPRSDGYIYVTDYGAIPYRPLPGGANGPHDSSANVAEAEADAGMVGTTVIWSAGVYNVTVGNIPVPPNVINRGMGNSLDAMATGTVLSSGHPVFILTPWPGQIIGGPYRFEDMTIYGSISAEQSTGGLTLDNISLVSNTDDIDLEGALNYPFTARHCHFTATNYGLYTNQLGNARIEDSVFGTMTKAGVELASFQPGQTTDNSIKFDTVSFNNMTSPMIDVEVPTTNLMINSVDSESYTSTEPIADIYIGPNGGTNYTITNSALGTHAQYSIYNVQAKTLLLNDILAAPLYDPYHNAVTIP